ncbi:MAG: TSUP family transporter, partial [Leptolyngbyaceae cyanobacterium]
MAGVIALGASGLLAGILAGLLGIGGGTVLVPILVTLGYEPIQAVATSSLAIIITSASGSYQNWRMGYIDFNRVVLLGIPALVTAQIGVVIATLLPPALLLVAFAILLATNVYLVGVRKRLARQDDAAEEKPTQWNPTVARLLAGSSPILTSMDSSSPASLESLMRLFILTAVIASLLTLTVYFR